MYLVRTFPHGPGSLLEPSFFTEGGCGKLPTWPRGGCKNIPTWARGPVGMFLFHPGACGDILTWARGSVGTFPYGPGPYGNLPTKVRGCGYLPTYSQVSLWVNFHLEIDGIVDTFLPREKWSFGNLPT